MSTAVQLCVLEVGGTDFAIDLRRVDEIVTVPTITPVPRAPSFVEGVVKLRDEVIPVIDVRRRLGVPVRAVGPKQKRRERLVLCRVGRRRVGLVVDAVSHIIRCDLEDLRPAPLTETPGRAHHVIGVQGEAPRLRLLLDVKALLSEEPA